MAVQGQNIEYWTDFINLYRNLPALWNPNILVYKNKQSKQEAYDILLEKYREMEPNATLDNLKRKINTFRTCYRRELYKLRLYRAHQDEFDDGYVPSLWYFSLFDFLEDIIDDTMLENRNRAKAALAVNKYSAKNMKQMENAAVSLKRKENTVCCVGSSNAAQSSSKRSGNANMRSGSMSKCKTASVTLANDFQTTQQKHTVDPLAAISDHKSGTSYLIKQFADYLVANSESRSAKPELSDETDVLVTSWGILFKKLNATQQIHAQHCIMEVLHLGRMGKLSLESHRNFVAAEEFADGDGLMISISDSDFAHTNEAYKDASIDSTLSAE